MATVQADTMLIEILDQQDSGYVREDTVGTALEEKIVSAGVYFIPNRGTMSKEVEVNGKKTIANVPIQYIKGCETIDVKEQRELGYEKDKKGVYNIGNSIPTEDKIAIKKGRASMTREGDIALFDYLSQVNYRIDAPNRPKNSKVKAIFKVVQVDKKTESVNDLLFLRGDVINYIKSLVIKKGDRYVYQETKIDNILQVMNLFGGDGYPSKINVITKAAEKQPKQFLDLVSKLDNTTVTDIAHALELNVIRFNENTVEYVKDSKVLATLGTEKMKKDKQMEVLASLLLTPEYSQAYGELKVKTEIAKEEQFK